jgi:hypothetical protein
VLQCLKFNEYGLSVPQFRTFPGAPCPFPQCVEPVAVEILVSPFSNDRLIRFSKATTSHPPCQCVDFIFTTTAASISILFVRIRQLQSLISFPDTTCLTLPLVFPVSVGAHFEASISTQESIIGTQQSVLSTCPL